MNMGFSETMKQIRESIAGLTTAENAESVAKANNLLNDLETEHGQTVQDGQKAKDALVRLVQNTSVAQPPAGGNEPPKHEEEPKSLDDIVADSVASVIAKRPPKQGA